jgi:hypothetical protein
MRQRTAEFAKIFTCRQIPSKTPGKVPEDSELFSSVQNFEPRFEDRFKTIATCG